MEALGLYLIKSTIVSGVFYLLYRYLLRKESFFAINRYYLLISILFAYLFPFIKINLSINTVEPVVINTISSVVNQFNFIEELPLNNETITSPDTSQQHWWILPIAIVSVAFLFRFIKNLFQLFNTIHANEKITQTKFTLVLFNQQHTFSFFRYIFISPLVWNSPKGKSVVAHELSHAKHHHSLDRLFIEIMLIIFWMNPFIYLYRKALEEVHEFQADADATKNGSVKEYFNLVLQQASAHNYSPLMSPFSYKLIKKRIKMANYKSNPIKRLLVVVPLAVALLITFASSTISQTTTITPNEEIGVWPSDDRVYNSVTVDIFKTPDATALTNMDEKLSLEQSNVLPILINAKGQMLINGKVGSFEQVTSSIQHFLQNTPSTENSSPIIFLKKDINTSFEIANRVLTDVHTAIDELRNETGKEKFNKPYSQCNVEQKMELEKIYPRQIIIAPSKDISKNDNGKTSFSSPIKKEDLTKISSGYGMRMHPILKEKRMHNGVDYVAPLNTNILAISDGMVRKVNHDFKEGKGYGRFIIIDHENGYSSLYSQLNAYKVKEGQKVKKGDIIGLLGSSGYSTGPHLHLEIKKDGQFIDPEIVIK